MVSPPWEPYPERKRQLEERAKRSRNKRTQPRRSQKDPYPETNSSFSSSSSIEDHAHGDYGVTGYDADSVDSFYASHHGDSSKVGDGHARLRPEDCSCLDDGGCGDEDECCVHDLPGAVICPCTSRVSTAGIFEVITRSMRSATPRNEKTESA